MTKIQSISQTEIVVEGSEQLLNYWKNQLANIPLQLDIPNDYPRSAKVSTNTEHRYFTLSKSTCEGLQALSQQFETSPFLILLSTFNILLYRYTNQPDIVVAYPEANNSLSANKSANSSYNILPLRTDLSGNPKFGELLKREWDVVLNANTHNNLSFEIMEKTFFSINTSNDSSPFKIMFSYKDETEKENSNLKKSPTEANSYPEIKETFEITFFIKKTTKGFKGIITFFSELYSEQAIERMIWHFKELLNASIKDPFQKINDLSMLTAIEVEELLHDFNDSKGQHPEDKTLIDLFEEKAVQSSDETAVVFDEQILTYKELNERANKLARYLIQRGITAEELIPVCMERSVEMIIAIMAILKAGAAYVPIDPEYPIQRIKYILEDTQARMILVNNVSKNKLAASFDVTLIIVDFSNKHFNDLPGNNIEKKFPSTNLAYVIYTSGSTGKPKGVMIEHRAVADHCFGLIKSAGLQTCKSFAYFAPLVFDAGHSIIFTSFLLGATLHVIPHNFIMEGDKLMQYLQNNPVDCIKIVPSLWLLYAKENHIVLAKQAMIFGGESFSKSLLEQLVTLNYKGNIYNHYGPTEATIGKCIHKVEPNKKYYNIPIGKPFSNTRLYIVDQFFQLVPVGVAGELCIAGEGLARAYLNQPALTAEKFIVDIFSDDPTDKMYRTGDKAKWLPDGDIEYLGRIDQQVKISGHRIELGEIESTLGEHTAIQQVVAMARQDKPGETRLVAYYTIKTLTQSVEDNELRQFLNERLPNYMVPAVFVKLDSIPLTINDKIDRAALPVPETVLKHTDKNFASGKTKLEKKLAKIVANLLHFKKIGVRDNLFELGMNSMQAYSFFSKIEKETGIGLSLSLLFKANTIEQIAAELQKDQSTIPSLVAIQPNGTRTPIFLIHAGRGTVLFYRQLAVRLGEEQPLFGLQPKGLDGKVKMHKTIEEMARHYVGEILIINPNGPFLIGGYCFGGVVAFEMAHQLKSLGYKVDLLVMFNTKSPTFDYVTNNKIVYDRFLQTKKIIRAEALANATRSTLTGSILNPSNKYRIYLRSLKQEMILKKRLLFRFINYHLGNLWLLSIRIICNAFDKLGLKYPAAIRKYYFWSFNSKMAEAYQPKAYDGRLHIFRSPGIFADPHIGWSKFVTGEITTINIQGLHQDRTFIIREPFVASTAKKLNAQIEAVSKKTASAKTQQN
ncbi:MAG: amino acid adenylation domain-containing protein [Ferruginibacter sp.]